MSFDTVQLGKSIIVSAPSGAGKTTIVRKLMEQLPSLAFSISACSRNARPNEVDGKDYYFLGLEGFKSAIEQQEFIEWEEVYQDHYYGTLKKEVQRLWNEGKVVIFDVDVVGGMNLKKLFQEKALSVFIEPPSLEVLEQRLRSRETESEERITLRLKKAGWEIAQSKAFDVSIKNEDLATAVAEAMLAVSSFITP
ncbi:MAG: guanylate kinase [Flavobacteriia bacterium]|jgi:guanylate kinase|nr:guanylate kinase [Flavobacteriia bacterium]NBP30324.1 guanylate kinase [Flavobacteriia bacterium]